LIIIIIAVIITFATTKSFILLKGLLLCFLFFIFVVFWFDFEDTTQPRDDANNESVVGSVDSSRVSMLRCSSRVSMLRRWLVDFMGRVPSSSPAILWEDCGTGRMV
jgi:hypothetical protein